MWGSVLGCGRVYGVSVESVGKSVERCEERDKRVCGGVGRGKERCEERSGRRC